MGPVKLATCLVPPGEPTAQLHGAARAANVAPSDVPWLQFGDELVYAGTGQERPTLTASASRAGLALRERPGTVDGERLHVIVQKGRLFQREHPDVPILVDKGRFLLVEMDIKWGRRLKFRTVL